MMKQISTGLISAVLLLHALGCSNGKVRAAAPPPAPVVEVAPVIQKDVPVQGEWVGTLEGYVNAQIQPQVSGYLIRQDYHEGALVKKGQLLFEIDPRPFQAVLDQAKGQLAQAEAQMANAETNVKRDIPEAEAHAIPQSQLDTDTQSLRGAKAAVEAAQASVEQAELNLGYTRVVSLVDGIAGINTVQVGNLVGPSTVHGPHRGFAGESNQGLFSDQRTGIPAHGGRRQSGERGLSDTRLTNPVAVNLGRRECLPASRQNHLRGPSGKHADRNHPDRGRVPQLQEPVATGPICTHSDAHRKYHGSAAGAAGGRESAARNVSDHCRRRR
jgi:multidrug efflux pump subunit AcrA (membrane-fusion protein)